MFRNIKFDQDQITYFVAYALAWMIYSPPCITLLTTSGYMIASFDTYVTVFMRYAIMLYVFIAHSSQVMT